MGSVKEANKKDFDLLCSFRLISNNYYLNNVATVHAEDLTLMYSYSVQQKSTLLGLVRFMKNGALPEHHITAELC